MHDDTIEAVLGIVAGLRGEKRAAKGKAVAKSVKWLVSKLRRGKSLLTGSHLDRLEAHSGSMAAHYDRVLNGPYARAEDAYKALRNRDPLRSFNFSHRRGDLDLVPRGGFDPSKLTADDYRLSEALKPEISRASDELGRVRGVLDGLRASGYATEGRILREAKAVRNARIAAGLLGALGLGGSGYGTYKALSGEKKAAARLHKAAQWRWAGKAFKPVRRYWTLLRGGDQELVGGYKATMRSLARQSLNSDPLAAEPAKAMYKAMSEARWTRDPNHLIRFPGRVMKGDRNVDLYLPRHEYVSDATVSELNKSLAARTATGAGILGVGTYGLSKLLGGGDRDEGMS